MKEINNIIGKKIMKLRTDYGLTQISCADCIGVSRPSMVNIEKGRQALTIDNLYKIADVLECEVSDILPKVSQIITPMELPESLIKEIDKIAGSKQAKVKKLLKMLLK